MNLFILYPPIYSFHRPLNVGQRPRNLAVGSYKVKARDLRRKSDGNLVTLEASSANGARPKHGLISGVTKHAMKRGQVALVGQNPCVNQSEKQSPVSLSHRSFVFDAVNGLSCRRIK
ncbi:MAG: hypothetical protein ACI9KE_001757 [Polyangiales bacterium]|jgi:hypothetical protein